MAEETKMRKIKIFAYALLVVVFTVGVVFYSNLQSNDVKAEMIKALTEKDNYSQTEELKVEIENKEGKRICFSSCYPYAMQTKNGSWNDYSYSKCEEDNVAEFCIETDQSKAFAIPLNEMSLKPSINRLAIPACVGCAIGEQFRVDKIIYSNQFEIK